jgi:hypothetical protein
MSEQRNLHNNDIEVSQFGLTNDFVVTLNPEDFRGVINAIAKYAVQSRHPDKFRSGTVSYDFGVSDVRTLTAFVGKLNLLNDEEIEDIKQSYSEETTLLELSSELKKYQELYSEVIMENTRLKTISLEYMLPIEINHNSENQADKNVLALNDISSGTYYYSSSDVLPNGATKQYLMAIDFAKGGKITAMHEMESSEASYLEDSEEWIQNLVSQLEIDEELKDKFNSNSKNANIIIDKCGNEVLLLISLDDGTVSQKSITLKTGRKTSSTKKEYMRVFYPISKKTGNHSGKLVVSKYSSKKINILGRDSYILGISGTEVISKIDEEKRSNSNEYDLPEILSGFKKDELSGKRNSLMKKFNLDTFWSLVQKSKSPTEAHEITKSDGFSRIITNPLKGSIIHIYELGDPDVEYTYSQKKNGVTYGEIDMREVKPQNTLCPSSLFNDGEFLGISYKQ